MPFQTFSNWEEDFSEVKKFLNGLGDWRVENLVEYLDAHPEHLAQCANLIQIVAVNQATLQMFRANHESKVTSHRVSAFFVNKSWQVFRDEIVALMEGQSRFEGELSVLDSQSKIKSSLLRLSIMPGSEETLAHVLLSFIDITERKEMEEALSSLSRRLYKAQEAERRNVARELHDEIGQVLTAVKSNLQTSRLLSDRQMSANFLEESIGIVDQALQQVRDLSLNLRPSLLA